MKRRRWRALGIVLGVLTGISIAIATVGPRLLDLNRYHGVIASAIEGAVGGRVRLGQLSWGFSPGIWVRVDGIEIADASAFPGDLSASHAYFSVSIPPLLLKRIVLNRALLERPEVRLRLEPRAGPCSAADRGAPCSPDAGGRSTGAAGAVDVEIRQLVIDKGRLTLDDRLSLPGHRMVRVFADVDITATQEIRGGKIAFDVALRDEAPAGLGALKAQGTFRGLTPSLTIDQPHLSAHATVSSLHAHAIAPYLRDSAVGRHLGGSASLTVHYDGDLSSRHRAEGVLDISHTTYTDPSLWPSALTSADAGITCAVSLTPDELTVETFVLKLGQLSVRGGGRVQGLKQRPVVRHAEVSADLPLPELAGFIPWKAVRGHADAIRSVLEAGGRIAVDRAVLPDIALAGPPTPAETVLRKTELTAEVTGMSLELSPSVPALRNIRGTLRLADGVALVQGLRAQVGSMDLPDMSAKITSVFKTPSVQGTMKGPLRLSQTPDAEVSALLGRLGVEEASGAAEVDLAVAVDPARPEAFQLRGHVGLRDATVKTGFSPARLEGLAADLALVPGGAQISSLETTVAVPAAPPAHGDRFTVQLAARIDDWRRRPRIALQRFKTSAVSLPDLATLVPWEELGDSAIPVKDVFLAGGTVTIDSLILPSIDLSMPLPIPAELIRRVTAAGSVTDLSVRPTPDLPRFEGITGRLSLADGVLKATDVRGKGGPLSVDSPGISATITRLPDEPGVQGTIKGPLRLSQTPRAEVAALLRRLGVEEASGAAEVDLAVAVDPTRPEAFRLRGHVGLRDVALKTGFSPARLEGLAADLALAPDVAQISTLSTTVAMPAAPPAPGDRFTVQLDARVDGWRGRPAITLQRLTTSPVPLPAVASLLPWEKLGDSATPFKDVLVAGGTVAIEELTLPPIDLSAPPPSPAQLIPGARAAASVADLSVRPTPELPRFEGITGHISLAGGVLKATDVRGRAGPLLLPELNVRITDVAEQPKVAVQAKGPVQATTTSDPDVEKLLRQFGLKSLTGHALIDMRATYDRLAPDDWEAHGTLVLAGVRAETHPGAVVMDGLRGRVTVDRGKATDIVAEDVTAQVDRAPVRLSGTFLGLGTPGLVVNASAYAGQLNLAHVREFFPALRRAGLTGTLDMDLHVYLPYAEAGEGRVSGMLATHDLGLRLPAADVVVKDGDAQFVLSGNTVDIQRLRLRLNDQAVEVTGHIATPVAPDIHLAVTMPDLDLDRLIPPRGAGTPGTGASQPKASQIETMAGASGLPAMARKLTGQLQVRAPHGRYRGLAFQDLKLGAAYDHGLLTDWALDFGLGAGQVSANGTADLRDPDRVAFVVRPRITSLELEAAAAALGIDRAPLTGPISLTGQLLGHTGRTKDLLATLEGTLDATAGPGTFTRIGRFGATMAKILSFASVQGLISAKPLRDLMGTGMSYRAITTKATFDKGSVAVRALSFRSDAMDMTAEGRIDLIAERMAMQGALNPLGTAGSLLGQLPITGKPVGAMTSIHLEAQGPLGDPDIRLSMGTGIETAIKGEAQGAGSMLRRIFDALEKGARTLFGK